MFDKAFEILNDRFPFWTSRVLDIGSAVMDDSIDTACISLDPATGDFSYRFNPTFAESLSDEGKAFIMSHEAMHVARNDMAAMPGFDDPHLFNVAADCIINDTLVNAGMRGCPEGAMRGAREVGFDCEGKTLEEVYSALQSKQGGQGNNPAGEPGGSGDEPSPTGAHDWDEADAQAAAAHASGEGIDGDTDEDKARRKANRAPITEADLARMDWERLFSLMDARLVTGLGLGFRSKADWSRPNRVMPHVRLPAKRNAVDRQVTSRKPEIVVVLDMSNSVTPTDKALFRALRDRLPRDLADYRFIISSCEAYILDDGEEPYSLGPSGLREATSAHELIVDMVNDGRLRGYPKAVLMVTDAEWRLTGTTRVQASRWLILSNNHLIRDKTWRGLQRNVSDTHNPAVRRKMLPVGTRFTGIPGPEYLKPSQFRTMREFVR